MLEEIELGPVGREWLIENLQDGLSLARSILRFQDVAQGTVAALLPAGTGSERAAKINTGWQVSIGASNHLGAMILDYLRVNPATHCIVFEDFNSKPEWPWMDARPPRVALFYHEQEVYFLIRAAEALHLDAETVGWEVKSHGAFYPKVVVFTMMPSELLTQATRQPVAKTVLQFMAAHTCRVFVAAYDDQSYLVWRRDEVSS